MLVLVLLTTFVGGCDTDLQCKGDRICQQGLCVAPSGSADGQPTQTSSTASSLNLHVNALGLLQFGLAPAVEYGNESFSVVARARFYNTGVGSYFLIGDPSSDDNFVLGLGGGVGVRGWLGAQGTMRGFYYGASVEYAHTQVDDEEDDKASYRTDSLIPVAEFGYRWVFGNFLLGVGINAGAAFPVSYEDVPIGADGCEYSESCTQTRNTFPFGMLALDVGTFL